MKTTPAPLRPAQLADPEIVAKVRRDNARYADSGPLLDGMTANRLYAAQLAVFTSRLLEFGRTWL